MSVTTFETGASPRFPSFSGATVVTLIVAGIFAVGAWEVWARFITPFWIGGPLQPSALVKSVFALNSTLLAELIHFATGVLAFPLGYLIVARPLAKAMPVTISWPVTGLVYGTALWIFALYGMAHLVAGFPPFLGFGNLAWASLVGHLIYGVVLAGIVELREE